MLIVLAAREKLNGISCLPEAEWVPHYPKSIRKREEKRLWKNWNPEPDENGCYLDWSRMSTRKKGGGTHGEAQRRCSALVSKRTLNKTVNTQHEAVLGESEDAARSLIFLGTAWRGRGRQLFGNSGRQKLGRQKQSVFKS
jgi:hypothetical protein